MIILNIALILFIVLETANILLLYFKPESRMGNGMGAFTPFHKIAADDPEIPTEMKSMVRYLVNWVAGTKLIFIALLVVIVVLGSERIKLVSLMVLIPSVATYYWRLHPIIRDMDGRNEIEPKGYSRTLGGMIAGFIVVFAAAAAVSLLTAGR